MDSATIIRMANQIADFYRSYPHGEAVQGTAEHINRFWESRMRKTFFDLLAKGGEGFDPLVKEAASLVRQPKAA